MALTATQTSVVNLLVGMFNGAPGKAYLDAFTAQIEAGKAIDTLAEELSASPAFTSIYSASLSNADFAKAWVGNLFGGAVTDPAGVSFAENYITGLLNNGATRADAMQAGMNALVAADNADPIFGKASAQLENKMKAAANYSETQTATDLATLQGAIANVTDDPSTIPPVQNGTSFTLTHNSDTASANIFTSGLVFTPGGDDRINALQDEDTLTGLGVNATLNATLGNSNDNGATTVTPTLNNIDTINVKFTGSGGTAVNQLDLQDSTGLANAINIERINDGIATATIDNIGTVSKDLSVKNSGQVNQNVDFEFSESAVNGSADSANLSVSNINLNRLSIQERAGTVDQGVETLNLNSSGSANSIDTLRAEELQTLNITGDKDLNLGGSTSITAGANPNIEATTYQAGLANVVGSLSTVNAKDFTGNLSLTIGNEINGTKDGTSGVPVQLAVTGGTGDDVFRLAQGASIDATATNTDTIDGGEGANKLVLLGGGAQVVAAPTAGANLKNLQALEVRTGHDAGVGAEVVTVDADAFDSLATIFVRNEGQNGAASAPETATVNLNDLTAEQATAITVAHGTTGNNGITGTTVNVNLKNAAGTADSAAVTLIDGINTDARSNLILAADGKNAAGLANAGGVESVTINDTDSEDNTVALANVAEHTSKITLTGGQAGKFLNLDTTTNGAGASDGGLYGYDTDGGSDTDDVTTGFISDITAAGQTRIVADEVDASGHIGNVVLRVSTSDAANGAQKITTGTGDDTVIFDNLNDNRAGLTISDTVAAGAGNDTLVIDGNLAAGTIALGASEWTNVSGFENIRLIDAGAGTYQLTLTDALIAANKDDKGLLNIINDNDSKNDTAGVADTAGAAGESAAVIDARTLSATTHFTYNGEEGASRTNDRFILSDANINGGNIIDGGAVNNVATAGDNAANADIIEIRNDAVVTVGDLDGIKNIGNINFNNDKAVAQTLTLQLNDTVVDAMVDSYHTSTTTNAETLTITANDGTVTGGGDAALIIDAAALTAKSNLVVNGNSGADTIVTGAGADVITGGAKADTLTGGAGNDIFSFTAANTTSADGDTITDFTVANDKLRIDASDAGAGIAANLTGNVVNIAGSANNSNIVDAAGTGYANFALAEAAVEAANGGTLDYSLTFFNTTTNRVETYIDADSSAAGNEVLLTGMTNFNTDALADVALAAMTATNFEIV